MGCTSSKALGRKAKPKAKPKATSDAANRTTSDLLKPNGMLSKFDHIPNDANPPSKLLTVDQKVIVRNTWSLMNGGSVFNAAVMLGKKIFLRIFELCPDIKQLFPFRDDWGDRLLNSPHFQAHASRFMQVVISAIENLDYLDTTYAENVYILGKSHAYQNGFTSSYFDTFLASMIFIWQQELRHDFTDETERSWKVVFSFVIDTLKKGYEYEMTIVNAGSGGGAGGDGGGGGGEREKHQNGNAH